MAMQEHAQRKTNETILAGLRIIEFGNGGIGNSGEVALTGDAWWSCNFVKAVAEKRTTCAADVYMEDYCRRLMHVVAGN